MLARILVKLANSRLGVPVKAIVRRLRETYYNAEVITRPVTKTAPLRLDVQSGQPVRINLLIPEVNFSRFYGGYIAKFHLARKLVERGYRVRVITIDQCIYDLETWKREIQSYAGLETIFDQIEVLCRFDRSQSVPVSSQDRVIATTWWSAFIAHQMVKELNQDSFVYLIQEYEPFTFPLGSYYALANSSYEFPHHALYSTELLQDYFKLNRVGYLHKSSNASEIEYDYFENAIIRYEPFEISPRPEGFRLLFYARPEAHAARNMFEIGYIALARAIDEGCFEHGTFEFHGIGSSHGDIPLPKGHNLKMLGKFGLQEYKEKLLDYDLGLALMYTPHPSLLPLEMAAAGMLVVTNSCMNKSAESMSQISSNLLTAEPTIDGVVAMLRDAARNVSDYQSRTDGSRVQWANDWENALDSRRMDKLVHWLS
ncbi:MAG: hypothetical protein ACI9FD_000280 [Gammaproteobacteria bacterium]